ncbi:glycosyltransferase family 4 protein [Fictibacillus sp. FJAT-27399]|uniref:glycosyltransferase family 4 protein n=1 Tax=Fictibacillus sp. FJAT-27399 TaxID=1729689 RepID=UPI0007814025|nr:glycosyltransferase family 4 protein [Fictibacillus sp. FJAT-27399]
MKKIMILVNDDIWLYKLRKEVIRGLLDEGFEVYLSSPKGEYIERLVGWGCNFVETKVDRRGKNPLNDIKLFLNYVKILKKYKPDAVLAYNIKPNIYGGLASRLLNVHYINNITGLGSGFLRDSLMKKYLSFMYKISLKKSDCVFFQNQSDMKSFLDLNVVKDNYKLIPGSGVNLNDYQYKEIPNKNSVTFNFIGRIMKDKGIDEYLEAAKVISGKYPNTEFNLIGFVEETQSYYRDKINSFQNKGYVNYLGFQSNVIPLIEKADCLIQPSHGGEGISNVLLETAATGRALIASDIPGCRETIDEGKNGYIFEAKNSMRLVEKIEKFINLPYDAKVKMGKRSRIKVEKEFDRNIVVNAYISKINQMLNEK